MKIIYREERFSLENNPLENTDIIVIGKLTKSDFDSSNPDNNHHYRIIRFQRPKYPEVYYGIKERVDLPKYNYLRIMPFITNECYISSDEFNDIAYLIEYSENKIKEVPDNIISDIKSNNEINRIYLKGEHFEKNVTGFDILDLTRDELNKRIDCKDKINNALKEYFLNELDFVEVLEKIRDFINKKLYS